MYDTGKQSKMPKQDLNDASIKSKLQSVVSMVGKRTALTDSSIVSYDVANKQKQRKKPATERTASGS